MVVMTRASMQQYVDLGCAQVMSENPFTIRIESIDAEEPIIIVLREDMQKIPVKKKTLDSSKGDR